jgi:toxin-antitoxin system PIN domain toxin
VILPDVNVLVYAFRREASQHREYADWLRRTAAQEEVALAESATIGFVRIVTSTRIMGVPAPTGVALSFVDALRGAPRAYTLAPTPATWARFRSLAAADPQIRGPLVPDAWLAALAITHGCRLASADRGFARFDGLDWFVPVPPSTADRGS